MHYLATLVGGGEGARPGTPEFDAGVAKYAEFEQQAAGAIAGGAALYPPDTAISVRRDGGKTLVTDGPFTEQAEVVGGFYVFECANLDEAIQLARKVPAAARGSVEVRPMVMWSPHTVPGDDWWTALLWEPQGDIVAPGTPEWEKMAVEHQRFAENAGAAIQGAGALQPPETATVVRERDGKLLLTDGPYTEGAEVVDGLYVFTAASREQAAELAQRIPRGDKGRTEVRRIVNVGF
ncbi:hypothetical protein DFR70_105483 [Nocardia tenerifensis]|uniref:YCII-related domain-containing protein n=1 Tax=Nocardia tenerifensis TaxID=228006 RepID=A0A318K205_9NOCA|nr:YciI family protein [Nocardia tenerifensis]PXX64298.1 hypothetical protein DFR70_105483 [Nocardia tenerifensis]